MTSPKMKLGSAVKDDLGVLHGRISGLGIGSIDFISEQATAADGGIYYRLIANPLREPYEVGVAFPKEKDGMHYYAVSIDSPVLPTPINAALFPEKKNTNAYHFIWNRKDVRLEATFTTSPPRRYMGASATP